MKVSNTLLSNLLALMKSITTGDVKDILAALQRIIDYQAEEILVYREMILLINHNVIPEPTDDQKCRLAMKAHVLSEDALQRFASWAPGLIIGWYRGLVGAKYNGSGNRKKAGRPAITKEVVKWIVRIATENPAWGYERIREEVNHLFSKKNITVAKATVERVLNDHGIYPKNSERRNNSLEIFIAAHREIMAACDFCTYEVVNAGCLIRYMLLFFEDINTRQVWLGGIVHDPDGKYMAQVARNQVDCFDGRLNKFKYLIHDRDPLFRGKFTEILKSSGIETILTTPRCPQQNGFIESFHKTIKTECLDNLVLTSEAQLRYAVHEYLEHYNHERPHSGLGGRIPDPWPKDPGGEIIMVSRLGGLLKSYRWGKLAA